MRILILGGDGMLGHQLLRHLGPAHEVAVTLRALPVAYTASRALASARCFHEVNASNLDRLRSVIGDFRPEAVVNAIGVVKQRPDAKASIPCIEINALFPHRLAELCEASGARLVHISTDCVFSGRRGRYTEDDVPDAVDLYGLTKLLGEVTEPPCITLRTSMIGPELSRKTSLYEWLRAQRGRKVMGYTRAVFSGFTTFEMARIIERILASFPNISGLYHVASAAITKHDLVTAINAACGFGVQISPDDTLQCDRSLDGSRFNAAFGYHPPSWEAMIEELNREDWGRVS